MSSLMEKQLEKVEKESIVNTLRKTEKEVKNIISSKSNIIRETLSLIMFALFTFVILGLVSLIDGDYDISKLGDLVFWGNWALVQIATVLAKIYATMLGKRKQMLENSAYIATNKQVEAYVKKDFEDPFIDKNVVIERRRRKVKAFTNIQKVEILKLARKCEITNSLEYLKKFDNENLAIDDLEPFKLKTTIVYTNERKQRKWLEKQVKISNKMNTLFTTLSKEWLDKNLDTQKVKYNEITKSLLVSGHEGNTSGDNNGFKYTSNATKTFIQANAPMFIFSALFLILIRPIMGSGFVKDASAWLNFITNVFLVIVSFVFSLYNALTLFEKDVLQPLIERETTLSEFYKKHQKEKGL